MGKSILCTAKFQALASKVVSSHESQKPKHVKPTSQGKSPASQKKGKPSGLQIDSGRIKQKEMNGWNGRDRVPLAHVVSELVKAWFEDALKAAKEGDIAMQVLVGQMYCNGYGVSKDVQKGRAWISQASKNQSSVWTDADKHPGYNESDSDSDELID
ncbi:hypothetical protein SLA2020_062640 [Shorea laevis]